VFVDQGYGSELPHLSYNENTTHVDVVLDHLKSRDRQSRFAVELALVASGSLGGEMSISQHNTLDDEHSPGSFHVGILPRLFCLFLMLCPGQMTLALDGGHEGCNTPM